MLHPARRSFISVLLITTALSAAAQTPVLVGYWHNWNDASAPYLELSEVDPRYDVVEVSFAVPEAGTSHVMEFAPAETEEAIFLADVSALQATGRKVLISMGGANAAVHLDSEAERDEFVTSMMSIMDTYGFDGLDIDLEGSSVSITGGTIEAPTDPSILRMITAIHTIADLFEVQHGRPMMLTMAPETAYVQGGMSAYGGIWGAYLPLIHALRDRITLLQVQLYNSGSMYGIDGGIYPQGTADFIVSQTEAVIQGFTTTGGDLLGLPASKVAIALPACSSAAGGGYADTSVVRVAMEYLLGRGPQPGTYALAQIGGYPDLGGLMTWSINWDATGSCNGSYSFATNYERIFTDVNTALDERPTRMGLLHPVPTRDRLQLGDNAAHVHRIVDLQGRSQMERTMSATGSVDVSDLAPGSYIIEWSSTMQHYMARFVKE